MIEECLVVEFRVTGDDCPLARATREANATVECRPPQARRDGNALLRFSVRGGADALVERLDEDEDIRYLHVSTVNGAANVRCLSKHPCVVHRLVDVGFMAESLQYRGGVETYLGAVVGHDVLRGVLAAAGEAVGVTLERVYPLGTGNDTPVAQRWDLTPTQEAALETALDMGYFEIPRKATASEVAAELGIGTSALSERLRRGQGALFAQLFR
ncbi:helix-turn-helix domain-containing protein [Halalkalicoccus sp. NIPERK01]|uniref:helix-turn-helix domain-containing protein n=1 Tax=Halalkalicoccus sp. NIPERK01 TaxID=3053469 RepID=UPI00256F421F|nr:helix-turn-helix domain-containing protein [Halalkalicoccus sp. NIPERK01]MDL5360981.1 helix-turn-helix domain-containing protein [Halalkalicoccus sp. NIPERK01]